MPSILGSGLHPFAEHASFRLGFRRPPAAAPEPLGPDRPAEASTAAASWGGSGGGRFGGLGWGGEVGGRGVGEGRLAARDAGNEKCNGP